MNKLLSFQNTTDIEAPLILPCWFPFDDYWKRFWIIFGIEYYIMCLGMLIVPCWHSFIVSIMGYVIIHLKILNYQLSGIEESPVEESRHSELSRCVNCRDRLACYIRELSSLISSSLFLDFIIFSVLLCMLLFQASQVCGLLSYSQHTCSSYCCQNGDFNVQSFFKTFVNLFFCLQKIPNFKIIFLDIQAFLLRKKCCFWIFSLQWIKSKPFQNWYNVTKALNCKLKLCIIDTNIFKRFKKLQKAQLSTLIPYTHT